MLGRFPWKSGAMVAGRGCLSPRVCRPPRVVGRLGFGVGYGVWLGVVLGIGVGVRGSAQTVGSLSGRVVEVVVEGHETIPTDQVLAKLRTRAGREFDERVLEDDVARLVQARWFADVRTRSVMGWW